MGKVSHNVVVVIPDNALRELIGELISQFGHTPRLFDNEGDAMTKCSEEKFAAAVVVDWELTKKYFPNINKIKTVFYSKVTIKGINCRFNINFVSFIKIINFFKCK